MRKRTNGARPTEVLQGHEPQQEAGHDLPGVG
jgi:hypothetical protein